MKNRRLTKLLFTAAALLVLAPVRLSAYTADMLVVDVRSDQGRQTALLSGQSGYLAPGEMYDVYANGLKCAEIVVVRAGSGGSTTEVRTVEGSMAGVRGIVVSLMETPYIFRQPPQQDITGSSFVKSGPRKFIEPAATMPPPDMEPKIMKLAPPEEPKKEEPKPPPKKTTKIPTVPISKKPAPPPPEPARDKAPYVIHGMLRLENHSDQYNPDDYFYGMLSASRQVNKTRVNTGYYLRRENLDHNDNHSDTLGINFLKILDKRTYGMIGVSYTWDDTAAGGADVEYSLWTIGATRTIAKKALTEHKLGVSYAIREHDLEDKSAYLRYSLHHKLDEDKKGVLSYLYTYSDEYNVHISNQYGATLTFLNPGFSIEYIYVEKTYRVPGSIQVDDDEIYRFSLLRKL